MLEVTMEENQSSRSALATAFQRGYHTLHDHPIIFDDSIAYKLLTGEEQLFFRHYYAKKLETSGTDPLSPAPDQTNALEYVLQHWTAASGVLSRSRYTEDTLKTHSAMVQLNMLYSEPGWIRLHFVIRKI
jgi:O-methyltransferase involved in polyketide biosynthesis